MKKYFLVLGIVLLGISFLVVNRAEAGPTVVETTASSTTFTLTTTAQRLVATSTKRTALIIQPTNCTASNVTTFLKLEPVGGYYDIAATANDGMAVLGSTTAMFSDYGELPTPENSVKGITGSGTCTVLVTEWRAN